MAQHAAELFVQCVYSPDLSYDDLLALEGSLKLDLTEIMETRGGEFIHFEEMGDTMRAQCVFPEYRESLFHGICDSLAPFMDGRVEARLLFVDKDLDAVHFYAVSGNEWRESCVGLPAPGPLTTAFRDQDPV